MSNTEIKEDMQDASLEEMFGRLDEIIGSMQAKDMTLEETFAGYKKGLELVQKCDEKIAKIECDIKLLTPEVEE